MNKGSQQQRLYINNNIYTHPHQNNTDNMNIEQSHDIQSQLQTQFTANQKLYQLRAQQIVSQLRELSNKQHPQVQLFLQTVHLDRACEYFQQYANNKREKVYNDSQVLSQHEENDLNKDLIQIALNDKQEVKDWINSIKQQNTQITKRIERQKLAEKHSAIKVLQLQQKIIKNSLNSTTSLEQPNNACINFAYQNTPSGKLQFSKSYIDIIKHNLARIKQNQVILKTLQRTIQQKVKQCEILKFKVGNNKQLRENSQRTKTNVQNIKNKIQRVKQQLRQSVRAANQQIEHRLANQLGQKSTKMQNQKHSYDRAYHSLLEVFSKVIDNADLDKVSNYIHQN